MFRFKQHTMIWFGVVLAHAIALGLLSISMQTTTHSHYFDDTKMVISVALVAINDSHEQSAMAKLPLSSPQIPSTPLNGEQSHAIKQKKSIAITSAIASPKPNHGITHPTKKEAILSPTLNTKPFTNLPPMTTEVGDANAQSHEDNQTTKEREKGELKNLTTDEKWNDLDQPAQSSGGDLHNSPPPYPALSHELGEEGMVIVRVLVNTEGKMEQIELAQSSGFSRLDNAALKAAKAWQYIPAQKGSHTVKSWILVPFKFALKDN